jgi:hypothetical protein
MASLRVIRALVFDKCNRLEEARDEIFGVLAMVKQTGIVDHYLLDTL